MAGADGAASEYILGDRIERRDSYTERSLWEAVIKKVGGAESGFLIDTAYRVDPIAWWRFHARPRHTTILRDCGSRTGCEGEERLAKAGERRKDRMCGFWPFSVLAVDFGLCPKRQKQVRICRATCKPLGTGRSYLQTNPHQDTRKHFSTPNPPILMDHSTQPLSQAHPHWPRPSVPDAGPNICSPPILQTGSSLPVSGETVWGFSFSGSIHSRPTLDPCSKADGPTRASRQQIASRWGFVKTFNPSIIDQLDGTVAWLSQDGENSRMNLCRRGGVPRKQTGPAFRRFVLEACSRSP
jgi:hypothetical protein